MKGLLARGRYRNVLFNLDQCGHSRVECSTIVDIMHSIPSVEIFYTFAIETLLAFLRKAEPALLESQLRHLGIDSADLAALEGAMSKNVWLGTAERLVFEAFRTCALYVSPFSINNPSGWRYWLIHFANFYRARQVYNNVTIRMRVFRHILAGPVLTCCLTIRVMTMSVYISLICPVVRPPSSSSSMIFQS